MIKYFLCENATGEIVIDGQKKKMKVIKLQLNSYVKMLKDGIVINVVVIVKNKINSEVDKVNTEVKCLRSARDWKGER